MNEPAPTPLHAQNLSGLSHIRHGFFTREGGVSHGIYQGLNCGTGSADEPADIATNRARVSRSLDLAPQKLCTLYQIHSAVAVTHAEVPVPDKRTQADGQATALTRLGLGVLAADCAPVLFAARNAKIVASAHAGWRGACSGIIEATVKEMEKLGAKRGDIVAAVGPCISPKAYEVGPDMRDMVLDYDIKGEIFFYPGKADRLHFDLPGYVAERLARAGVGSVEVIKACTYADEARFFSWRRTTHRNEPDYGRQISVISLS